jgi:hypothetical protein
MMATPYYQFVSSNVINPGGRLPADIVTYVEGFQSQLANAVSGPVCLRPARRSMFGSATCVASSARVSEGTERNSLPIGVSNLSLAIGFKEVLACRERFMFADKVPETERFGQTASCVQTVLPREESGVETTNGVSSFECGTTLLYF